MSVLFKHNAVYWEMGFRELKQLFQGIQDEVANVSGKRGPYYPILNTKTTILSSYNDPYDGKTKQNKLFYEHKYKLDKVYEL